MLTAAPALAAVECNTVPSAGDFRIRFSTEKASYGLMNLHQDWIEKKTGRASRTTRTIFTLNAGPDALKIRTVLSPDSAKHPSYIEINGARAGATFNATVNRWSFRGTEDKFLPHWVNDGTDELTCIVD